MRKLLSKPAGSSSHHHDAAHGPTSTSTSNFDQQQQNQQSQQSQQSQQQQHHQQHYPQQHHLHQERPSTSPVPLLYRPNGPQEAAYQVGVPIASLDKSPDSRSAVLAGRHVLKTVRVDRADGLEIKETFDLRALITAQSSPRANSTVSISEQLAIRDVKWGTGRNDTHIFTACLHGKIFQYDLSRLGTHGGGMSGIGGGGGIGVGNGGGSGNAAVAFVQTQEDSRQINTLDINPHKDVYLLSGSQDGVVRCFDTRNLVPSRLGLTFKPMQAFKCNADVRHVQWSPREGFYFACCTEQGAVMKWDIRKSKAPVLRIAGHEKACSSLSWHPDGEHLISGGVDKKCHVWDMSRTAEKRQKPKWTIHTPALVAAVAWRPGQWSATCQGLRAAQIAVSYDVSGPKRPGINAAHVWDLARPTIPYKTIERFECSPSALLWKDQEFLWTAGEDGLFCQNDVTFAPRVIDRTAVSTLSFSSCGDVLTFLDERPPPPRPRVLASVHKDLPSATVAAAAAAVSSSYGSDPTTPTLSISRSDSEDDVVRGFLMPRRRIGRRRRASSVHHLSSTPPSNHPAATNSHSLTVSLEDSLRATGTFRPQQIMAIGHIPSAARKDTYGYLAKIYLETLLEELPPVTRNGIVVPLPDRIASILDSYARAAENVSQFRLAQVWRIIAFAMDLLFRNRAQYHKERRLEGPTTSSPESHRQSNGKIRGEGLPPADPSGSTLESMSTNDDEALHTNGLHSSNSRTLPVRSLLAEEIESTSNMPTPLARPVSGMAYVGGHYDQTAGAASGYDYMQNSSYDSNGLPSDIDSFNLPPARYQDYLAGQPRRRHLNSMPISEVSHESEKSHMSSMEGYDFYDTEAMANAIDVPGAAARPPAPPPVDFMASRDSNSFVRSPVRAQFLRQDSTDSAAGRIFEISQASGHALDDSDLIGSGSLTTTTTNTSARGRDRIGSLAERRGSEGDSLTDAESLSRSRGRQHGKEKPLASSVGSSRLLRLNKALLSMEWSGSGSNPTLSTPGVTRDTYYRTNSQDTESSSNSISPAPQMGGPPHPLKTKPVATNSFTTKRPTLRRSASSRQETVSVDTSELPPDSNETSPERLTDRDYLPWPHDPPFPFPVKGGGTAGGEGGVGSGFDRTAALNPYVIVKRALSFEVRTSPLHASAMVLLLKPLVPDDIIDPLQAKAILRQHHARLMGMKLFLEAALLRNLCVQGWPGGIELSKWGAGANYTSIIAPAQKNVVASYLCVDCKKPREVDHNNPGNKPGSNTDTLWRCERCKSAMAPCAVCGHRDVSAIDGGDDASSSGGGAPVLSTWWYCVGCSHGGHLSCLEGWHSSSLQDDGSGGVGGPSSPRLGSLAPDSTAAASNDDNRIPDAGTGTEFSDGCCPLDGCGHACLPGQWRTETIAQRSDDLAPMIREATRAAAATAAAAAAAKATVTASNGGSFGEWEASGGGGGGGVALNSGISNTSNTSNTSIINYNSNSNMVLGGSSSAVGEAGTVRADGNEVGQSRAVDMVRESLTGSRGDLAARTMLSSSPGRSAVLSMLGGSGGSNGSGGTGGIGSSGGGGAVVGETRERERRKSVKFAGTDDRS